MKPVADTLIFIAIFAAASLYTLNANAQRFESGEAQVPLIELYTSEGCSSCPPADRWLSKLTSSEDLWSGFVPMSFHVDYWDYIGWKDRFASREYSQRQRRYAAEYNERTVYTPGVRKSGEEWRSWRFVGKPTDQDAPKVGKMILDVAPDGSFNAEFDAQQTGMQLNVAILGVGLSSEVTRGENTGKTLSHDFVVLGISSYGSSEAGKWSGNLPEASVNAPKYAVAAWITKGGRLTPIQATGGYLVNDSLARAN